MIRVNLLPTFDEYVKVPVQIYAALAVLVVAALALGAWFWSLNSEQKELDNRIAALTTQVEQLEAEQALLQEAEKKKKATQDRIDVIKRLEASRKGPVELMNVVISSVPDEPGLWLTSLAQRENTVTIEGRAFDVPFIADFIASLNDSPPFRFVELQFWEQDPDDTIRFRLHCQTQEVTAEAAQ